jgi:GNAT superfamily N-acetyltransferase
VHIERFDPRADEKRLRVCHQMTVAGQPQDDPNVPEILFDGFRGWWGYGFAGNPMQTWLGTDDSGEPVGAYLLELPEKENRANAFGFVIVPPDRRRKGNGTTLLAHMAGEAAAARRTLLMSMTRIGAPGERFAAETGGTAGMREVRRTLPVDASLRSRLPGLRATAELHAAGYSLRTWGGLTPDDLVAGICAVYTALGDAPHDDAFEPAAWDGDRLRAAEQRVLAENIRWHSVAAIDAATGELAAVTQLNVSPRQPTWGWQEITAVTRRHRGHRLGLLVKAAMLELLAQREPELRRIVTFNAEQNVHMIAVNEQPGYRVSDYFQSWEHSVAKARELG